MKDINIEGTARTPKITFSEEKKRLLIEGKSTPENPGKFYRMAIEKIKNSVKDPMGKLEIDFKLEYFNTASSIAILGILRHFQSLHNPDTEVTINWHYDEEDEDLFEIGKDYSTMLDFPFNLVAIPN